jgi:hypothetical protein
MRYTLFIGSLPLLLALLCALLLSPCARADLVEFKTSVAKQINQSGLSDRIDVFIVDKDKRYTVQGKQRSIGAGFQPSVLLDDAGGLHFFFQARLDGSGDRSEKMIAHVRSTDGGKTFSTPQFINATPLQVYAMSSFVRKSPDGGKRLSVLTSLSVDETLGRLKDPQSVKKQLGIDVTNMSRKAGCIILEFYSDDLGKTWKRKEHRGISDRTYKRNGKDYYLAFINLIGQVRRIADGPHKGRLILGGPLRGSYLPCKDHPHFRNYHSSSSIIFSDDDGESWQFGGVISDKTAFKHNEASAVPVNGGKQILLVRRNNARGAKAR